MRSQSILTSALGWFDLGNYVEAFNELDNLPPEHRASVEALELRCRIYRKLDRWRELEMVAEGCFVSSEAKLTFGCHWAWALLKQGRVQEARAVLDKVPYTCAPELLFTAACILCAVGELELARSLISDAISFSIDPDAMKLRALGQPELESIWRSDTDHRPECN